MRSRRLRAAQQVQAAGWLAAPPSSGGAGIRPDPTRGAVSSPGGDTAGGREVRGRTVRTNCGGTEMPAQSSRGASLRARVGGARPALALPRKKGSFLAPSKPSSRPGQGRTWAAEVSLALSRSVWCPLFEGGGDRAIFFLVVWVCGVYFFLLKNNISLCVLPRWRASDLFVSAARP